jgi:hypothetical protein
MVAVRTTLLNQEAEAASFTPETLSLINLRLALDCSFVEKISVTASLRANWHTRLNNADYPLESIKLEIGSTDSEGIMSYRNTAKLVGENSGYMVPLIWQESNCGQIFQTEFLKGSSDNVQIRYQILFKISPVLPAGFKDQFSGSENLCADKPAQDFTLKAFLQ